MADSKPAGWTIEKSDGSMLGVQNTAFECEQLIAHFGENGDKPVALYRQPQPALFAGERAAMQTLMYLGEASADVGDQHAADTVRAVLERLK